MKILIIGQGGQISDMLSWYFNSMGHKVYQYRPRKVNVPGVPIRPKKKLERNFSIKDPLQIAETATISYRVPDNVADPAYDVVVIATPSYLIPFIARDLGKVLHGRVVINVSDRFMGGLELAQVMATKGHSPKQVICLNKTPLQSYSENYYESKNLYFFKRVVHYFALDLNGQAPLTGLIENLFPDTVQFHKAENYFDLAFENVHSILHAVQDLANLKLGNYFQFSAAKRLYSHSTYTSDMIARVNRIVAVRDAIAQRYTHGDFKSLQVYDGKLYSSFRKVSGGTTSYRQDHQILNQLPAPLSINCCGYEDIGWAMVPLEAMGILAGVDTQALSHLINEWNEFMGVNYRFTGRRLGELIRFGQEKGIFPQYLELRAGKLVP